MVIPPVYRNSTGSGSWQELMATLGAGGDPTKQLLLEIYNQLIQLTSTLNPGLFIEQIAPVGNVVTLGNNFTGNTIVAIVGVNAAGDVVPIATLIDAPAITGASFIEQIGIMAAINNANLQNNDNLINWSNLVNNTIELHLIAGHGLNNLVFVFGPSTNG